MEHIASAVNLDPLQVRMNNLISNGDAIFGIPGLKFKGENPVQKMIQDLKTSSAFDERKPFVDNFNKVGVKFAREVAQRMRSDFERISVNR